jgi:colanic acid/amylovoran biosynthesis glycosyltransferase
MRILHAVPAYYPSQGGIETLVRSIVIKMSVEKSCEFCILVPNYQSSGHVAEAQNIPVFTIVDGVRVYQVPTNADPSALGPRETLRLITCCRSVIEQFKPDLVHSHGVTVLTVPLAISTARLSIPLLWHLHGGLPRDSPSVLLKLLKDAPYLLTPSYFVRNEIVHAVGQVSKISVLENGIDIDDCDACLEKTHGERRNILMVGRLEKEKGFDLGLRAVAPLLIPHGRTLQILGTGPELPYLEELAVSLGVRNHVEFTGVLPHSECLAYMARAFALIVPSIQIEGFGLVAAEAGALGTPVIAFQTGGLPEVVVEELTGMIVETGDIFSLRKVVESYLKHPEVAALHGKNAQVHVRNRFNISDYVVSLLKIYQDLIGAVRPLCKEGK